jgi:glutathione S-transferase
MEVRGLEQTKLFGHPYSHNARKVHWALEEAGASYEYMTVDLMTGAQKAPDFVSLNPNGRVPVLEVGSNRMYESNAILLHLAEQETDLAANSAQEKMLQTQWTLWQCSDLGPAIFKPWFNAFMSTLGTPFEPDAQADLIASAAQPLAILNAHLAGRDTVTGQFSVADIALAESIGLCGDAGIDLGPYAEVSRWFNGMSERPAYQRTRPRT